jgi:hypothetical protein
LFAGLFTILGCCPIRLRYDCLIWQRGKGLLWEMTAQVHCQHCGHDFETEVDGKTTICPACEKETPINAPSPKPKAIVQTPPPPPPAPIQIKESIRIRQKAGIIEGIGTAFMGVGIAGILMSGLLGGTSDNDNQTEDAWRVCIFCASLLTIGIWLYLIGQIVHIRANTHKD